MSDPLNAICKLAEFSNTSLRLITQLYIFHWNHKANLSDSLTINSLNFTLKIPNWTVY